MTLDRYFGAAVRVHRIRRKLSQEELGARADLDRTYVSGIERGVRNPTLKVIQRLATALESDLRAILATAYALASKDRKRRH